MRRQGARLIPVDDIAADDLVRVPANRDVMVKITSSRNMKLMRFLWALASKVADACDHLHDREDAMDELKIRVRHVKYITNPATGEVRIVPKSLTKLDGPGLSRLADRMVFVICRDIVPGLSEETLRAEIMAMIDGTNSNSSQSVSSPGVTETDTPADAEDTPAAGNNSPPDGFPDGWQRIYADAMTAISDKPKSLATRRKEALAEIGGTASDDDKAEMAAIEDLVKRRNSGELPPDAFKAALREIVPEGVEV